MIKDIPGLIKHLTDKIKDETDVAVLGLSGGADSTLVATLCTIALGKENVYGLHMPACDLDTAGVKFNSRSQKFAEHIGIHHAMVPIGSVAQALEAALNHGAESEWGNMVPNSLDIGNGRARCRMAIAYGHCAMIGRMLNKRARVVGTGNLSEDFIGYDTKGGDALADFHPIGKLFKSEVYQLLDHFIKEGVILEDHVDRVPSAGLWPGQTDEGELGYTYNAMEPFVKSYLNEFRDYAGESVLSHGIVHFVGTRYHANKHKHAAIPSFDVFGFVE